MSQGCKFGITCITLSSKLFLYFHRIFRFIIFCHFQILSTLTTFAKVFQILAFETNVCMHPQFHVVIEWERGDDHDDDSKDLFCMKVFSVVFILINLVLCKVLVSNIVFIVFSFFKKYRSCRYIFLSRIIKNEPSLE